MVLTFIQKLEKNWPLHLGEEEIFTEQFLINEIINQPTGITTVDNLSSQFGLSATTIITLIEKSDKDSKLNGKLIDNSELIMWSSVNQTSFLNQIQELGLLDYMHESLRDIQEEKRKPMIEWLKEKLNENWFIGSLQIVDKKFINNLIQSSDKINWKERILNFDIDFIIWLDSLDILSHLNNLEFA